MSRFVLIPAGAFLMGSRDGQDDERPVHSVYADAFEMSVHPVTRGEYARFLAAAGAAGIVTPRDWTDPALAGDDRPVVGVSWHDAMAYCAWRAAGGNPERLPTEAEWERAARGGREGAAFPWGDEIPSWIPGGGRGPLAGPWPVTLGEPNAFGLQGIAANVHEWCADWHDRGYYAVSPDRNPRGPASGARRASRGGSWRHAVTISRCAARSKIDPSFRYTDYGFRTVRGDVMADLPPEGGSHEIDPGADLPPEGGSHEIDPRADLPPEGGSHEIGPRADLPPEGGSHEIDPRADLPPDRRRQGSGESAEASAKAEGGSHEIDRGRHESRAGELETAAAIARAVREAGGRALIVGGWVRDRLMGRPSKDIDVEVYGVDAARLKEILRAFGSVNAVGESFTVYKVADLDVSLPRRESKTGRGHRGFTVSGDPALPLKEAARRRDFTINAISWDPLTGEYEDPFDGRGDLERRLLRAVDPRTFGDDSLRVLRAVQFAARFEFAVEPETRALCRTIPLDDLPAERVWGEIEKLLLRAIAPSIGFALALELRVVERLFPELDALVGCPQEPEWHPEGDVWIHTLLVIDEARKRIDDLDYPRQVAVMLGAVCHDLGKPATTAFIEGRIRSLDHEEAGVPPSIALLNRLNVHSLHGYDVRREVLGIVANHLKPGMFRKAQPPAGDGAFRRLAQKVDLELLAIVARADCEGRGGGFDCSAMDWFVERARALGVEHAPPDPLVKGRHLIELGVAPGPALGEVLRQVYERQLDGTVADFDAAFALASEIAKERRLY